MKNENNVFINILILIYNQYLIFVGLSSKYLDTNW